MLDRNELNDRLNIINDIINNCGPIGGIYTALKIIDSKWLAIMPADMPFLLPEVYQILNNNRQEGNPVVAVSDSGVEPLVSIWPKSSLNSVESRVFKKKYKLNDLLQNLDAREIVLRNYSNTIDSAVFFNINSQFDLSRIK